MPSADLQPTVRSRTKRPNNTVDLFWIARILRYLNKESWETGQLLRLLRARHGEPWRMHGNWHRTCYRLMSLIGCLVWVPLHWEGAIKKTHWPSLELTWDISDLEEREPNLLVCRPTWLVNASHLGSGCIKQTMAIHLSRCGAVPSLSCAYARHSCARTARASQCRSDMFSNTFKISSLGFIVNKCRYTAQFVLCTMIQGVFVESKLFKGSKLIVNIL